MKYYINLKRVSEKDFWETVDKEIELWVEDTYEGLTEKEKFDLMDTENNRLQGNLLKGYTLNHKTFKVKP